MRCAQCGWENPPGARFCGRCGAALAPRTKGSGIGVLIGLVGLLTLGVGALLGALFFRAAPGFPLAPAPSRAFPSPQAGPTSSPTASPSPTPSPTPMNVFTDPWAYCAALASGIPDARYEGPSDPEPVARALIAKGVMAPGEPFTWRCKNGRVYACSFGATLPCWQLDTRREPHSELINYCRENPWTDFIPLAVTGHGTMYTWACRNGQPVITGELWEVDEEGYALELWYEIPPPLPSSGMAPRLTLIEPHFGRSGSVAEGVSDDGQVVVGYSLNARGGDRDDRTMRAFRWTPAGGTQDLGTLGRERTWAHAVSGDGRVVVGGYYVGDYAWRPFRWTPERGMEDLGTLGVNWADALDVSADGSVIAGYAYVTTPGQAPGWAVFAIRWTEASGITPLGSLPGYRFSHAFGVSADGTILVGETNRGPAPEWNESEAWVWSRASGMRGLERKAPWGSSAAREVSDDGTTVIGLLFNDADYQSWADFPYRAFRWRADTGLQDLGTLGGERTEVWHAVTRDGSMVFGRSQLSTGEWRAFRWTPERGMEDLNILYREAIPSGWTLRAVMDCSPDGRYLVGWAEGPGGLLRAFLLDTGSALR